MYTVMICWQSIDANSLEQAWTTARKSFLKLEQQLIEQEDSLHGLELVNEHWSQSKTSLRNVIMGRPDRHCWLKEPIQSNMVRCGFGPSQVYEECFLRSCLSKEVLELINTYQDTDLTLAPFESGEFNCSTNTLGHLYYAGIVLEQAQMHDINLDTIIEIGSGYGNLARIFKSLLPNTTLILIDLPEFLFLQHLFLDLTLPNAEIIVHSEIPKSFKKSAIHLVPYCFLEQIYVEADLFISTFGLSETTHKMQSIIAEKQFFNASVTYISGQLDGWKPQHNFEGHRLMHDAIRSYHQYVKCQPFHILTNGLNSYEVLGVNAK